MYLQVEELREKRTTWTMQGWRVTLKDGTQVMRAEPMVVPPTSATAGETDKKDVEEKIEEEGEKEKEEEGEEEGEDDEKDDEG